MAHLTPDEFDRLERAVVEGRRIAVTRHGRELVVIPTRLFMRNGRDTIEAQHPTTGDIITFHIDELEALEVVRW